MRKGGEAELWQVRAGLRGAQEWLAPGWRGGQMLEEGGLTLQERWV